ncbi:uncharacterized protein G2W53_036630 [Senna tora]|uniref:Uncharacterized protein n=1 Tax=Senna tora TaxID=362788 RepID=A0A834W5A5_9FABA|nr:uncharacterized protein G2W53_036630 [Senna tora]
MGIPRAHAQSPCLHTPSTTTTRAPPWPT